MPVKEAGDAMMDNQGLKKQQGLSAKPSANLKRVLQRAIAKTKR